MTDHGRRQRRGRGREADEKEAERRQSNGRAAVELGCAGGVLPTRRIARRAKQSGGAGVARALARPIWGDSPIVFGHGAKPIEERPRGVSGYVGRAAGCCGLMGCGDPMGAGDVKPWPIAIAAAIPWAVAIAWVAPWAVGRQRTSRLVAIGNTNSLATNRAGGTQLSSIPGRHGRALVSIRSSLPRLWPNLTFVPPTGEASGRMNNPTGSERKTTSGGVWTSIEAAPTVVTTMSWLPTFCVPVLLSGRRSRTATRAIQTRPGRSAGRRTCGRRPPPPSGSRSGPKSSKS